MKKKVLLVIAFIIAGLPVFAGGAAEIIGGMVGSVVAIATGQWWALGLTVGMFAGGIATVIQEGEEDEYNNETAYNNALKAYETYDAQVADTELDIAQTEANISAFDQALQRWQADYDLSAAQTKSEVESQYTALMENWQGVELANAERGQTGGSADIVAQQAEAQVQNLVGSDLQFDDDGGIWGQYWESFQQDSIATWNEYLGNRGIQQKALATYQNTLAQAKQNRTQALTDLNTFENKTNRYNSYVDSNGVLVKGTKKPTTTTTSSSSDDD